MKLRLAIILLISLFLISSCNQDNTSEIECNYNGDCSVSGCSGQICGKNDDVKDMVTTCEFLEEYACLKETSCSCIKDKCQWEKNNKYLNCLDKLK